MLHGRMNAQMDRWVDKTDRGAHTSYGTEEFAKLFECTFNIILAISKAIILHLMMPPIQLFMFIFFSYTLAFKGYTCSSGHSGRPLLIYKHVCKTSGLFTSCGYFLYNPFT